MIRPNKHGVYPDDAAETILFTVGGKRPKAMCEIRVLQIGKEWLVSPHCEFFFGDSHSSCGPLVRDRQPHLTRRSALAVALDRALSHFHTGKRYGCATAEQVRVSIEMHGQLTAYKAQLVVDPASLPVGTQFSLFGAGVAGA